MKNAKEEKLTVADASVDPVVMLPCPFCGHQPKISPGTGQVRLSCSNKKCGGHPATSWHESVVECRIDWNYRWDAT